MWDEITYQVPNFNGYTIDAWEWTRNFIPPVYLTLFIHAEIEVKPCLLGL